MDKKMFYAPLAFALFLSGCASNSPEPSKPKEATEKKADFSNLEEELDAFPLVLFEKDWMDKSLISNDPTKRTKVTLTLQRTGLNEAMIQLTSVTRAPQSKTDIISFETTFDENGEASFTFKNKEKKTHGEGTMKLVLDDKIHLELHYSNQDTDLTAVPEGSYDFVPTDETLFQTASKVDLSTDFSMFKKTLTDLSQHPDRFTKQLVNAEEQFRQHNYEGNKESNESFHVINGGIPVLISAPYSTKQKFDGKETGPDAYTGSTALALHNITNAFVIYSTQSTEQDPNVAKNSAYQKQVEKLIKNHNISLFINLRGAPYQSKFDVELNTLNGFSIDEASSNAFTSILKSEGFDTVEENRSLSTDIPNSLTKQVFARTGIDALDIRFNHQYQSPKNDMESYFPVIRALSHVIETHAQSPSTNEAP